MSMPFQNYLLLLQTVNFPLSIFFEQGDAVHLILLVLGIFCCNRTSRSGS